MPVRKACKVSPAQSAHRATRVMPVRWALKARKAHKAMPAHKARKAPRVILA